MCIFTAHGKRGECARYALLPTDNKDAGRRLHRPTHYHIADVRRVRMFLHAAIFLTARQPVQLHRFRGVVVV